MRAKDAQAGELAEGKRIAAEWAAELVETGMVVGLGTGSTALFANAGSPSAWRRAASPT